MICEKVNTIRGIPCERGVSFLWLLVRFRLINETIYGILSITYVIRIGYCSINWSECCETI